MYHWSMDWTYFPIKLAKPGTEYSHENLFLCRPGPGLTQPHSQLWCRVKTPLPGEFRGHKPTGEPWIPPVASAAVHLFAYFQNGLKCEGFLKLLILYQSKKESNIRTDFFTFYKRFSVDVLLWPRKWIKSANVVSTGQARDAPQLQGSESQAPSALLCSDLTALLPSRWLGRHPGSRPQEAGEPGVWGPTLGPASSSVCKLGQTIWAPVSLPIKWV